MSNTYIERLGVMRVLLVTGLINTSSAASCNHFVSIVIRSALSTGNDPSNTASYANILANYIGQVRS